METKKEIKLKGYQIPGVLNKSLEDIIMSSKDKEASSQKPSNCFLSNVGKTHVVIIPLGRKTTVVTDKGKYTLIKHDSQKNYYYGKLNGVKAHVVAESMVAKIIFWA